MKNNDLLLVQNTEGQGKSKAIKALIIVAVIIIPLLAVFALSGGKNAAISNQTVSDMDEMYDVIVKHSMNGDRHFSVKSKVSPDGLSYPGIHNRVNDADMYTGCEVYAYTYTYNIDSDGNYDCKINLSKPSKLHSKLTEIKVKKIAKKASSLSSDYEKVKAVHDYLVIHNNYDILAGGSYKALYWKHSACTGYAYSFYAIMKELGIPVQYVHSTDHVWNRVKVGDYWYNIDVTWDDPAGGSYNYDYFLKCNKDFSGHEYNKSDAPKSLPVEGKSAEEYYRMLK